MSLFAPAEPDDRNRVVGREYQKRHALRFYYFIKNKLCFQVVSPQIGGAVLKGSTRMGAYVLHVALEYERTCRECS